MALSEQQTGRLLEPLIALARLAMGSPGAMPLEHVADACAMVCDALHAEEAYIIRAGDPHFVRLGSDADPLTYEIKQKGYYLIWRELATNARLAGGGVHVVDRLLDAERQSRQRKQLALLADVAGAFSGAEQMDGVLAGIATALAGASGADWVTIDLADAARERVVDHAQNISRHGDTKSAGQFWELDGKSAAFLYNFRRVERTGQPLLVPDVFAEREEVDDDAMRRYYDALRHYYERAHILSTAAFPIRFQNELLGLAYFSSCTRREFDPEDVAFLTALMSQAAAGIGGLRLAMARRAAEAERAQLESVILAARGMAHELNQDLGVVIGRADLLEAMLGPEQAQLSAQSPRSRRRPCALPGSFSSSREPGRSSRSRPTAWGPTSTSRPPAGRRRRLRGRTSGIAAPTDDRVPPAGQRPNGG